VGPRDCQDGREEKKIYHIHRGSNPEPFSLYRVAITTTISWIPSLLALCENSYTSIPNFAVPSIGILSKLIQAERRYWLKDDLLMTNSALCHLENRVEIQGRSPGYGA